jgi:NitT/TauT family transport system substrate-binding protein
VTVRFAAWLSGVLVAVVLVVGCSAAPTPTPAPTATPLSKLTVGLGYIPSVQFAQFYRAQQQGYYRAAGLDVTFQNEIDPNLITLVGQGAVDVGVADGTSVIPAVGQGVPIKYAATIYAQFPDIVIAPANGPIKSAADLKGHSLGIPGEFGSSWIMLQALLASANLTANDLDIRDYPDFGQAVALQQGQVDSATGFRNNEPLQLAQQGFATTQLTIDQITPLPGPGLIVGTTTLTTKRDALTAFVTATLRAMDEIAANPQLGLDDTIAQVPDLGSNKDSQLAVLQATIPMWSSPYTQLHGSGAIDQDAWTKSLDFMRGLAGSNIPSSLTVDQLVTEELLP